MEVIRPEWRKLQQPLATDPCVGSTSGSRLARRAPTPAKSAAQPASVSIVVCSVNEDFGLDPPLQD